MARFDHEKDDDDNKSNSSRSNVVRTCHHRFVKHWLIGGTISMEIVVRKTQDSFNTFELSVCGWQSPTKRDGAKQNTFKVQCNRVPYIDGVY